MEDSFRSPRAKRSTATNGGGSFKRSKPPPPLTVAVGHVLFRLLYPLPLSGGVIGKSGAIVKQLQQDTAAKIHVEESPPGCDDRIIASSSVNKKIALKASKQGGEDVVLKTNYGSHTHKRQQRFTWFGQRCLRPRREITNPLFERMDYNGGDSIAQLTHSLTISLCLASQSNLTAICSQPTTQRTSKI
ncbi:hypothetical protein Acr_00g0086250 [Actinidia rufa]|uniref:K Homology domain-containing protein n=1 Tax=Actinidia rufa TaxID=165716 RepID=A0A7J0DW16_9ERIC|nr:hypothetical protein Acr_00g0086250 [Actinidia rufa]